MIDVHGHYLCNVDDGASSTEETLSMIDMAYKDGIKAIVTTPHYNHPMFPVTMTTLKQAYDGTKVLIKNSGTKIAFYFGTELYIDENYLDILETYGKQLTLNHSRYLLIESDRSKGRQWLLDVVHEIVVRGYRPIIAHYEMYPAFDIDTEFARELKTEGALIQITASSLLGKLGTEVSEPIKKLLTEGLVDFISTDAHGNSRRRPLMQKAYRMSVKWIGEKSAKRIFSENPKHVLADQNISKHVHAQGSHKRLFHNKRLKNIAAIFTVIFFVGSATFGLSVMGVKHTQKIEAYSKLMPDYNEDKSATQPVEETPSVVPVNPTEALPQSTTEETEPAQQDATQAPVVETSPGEVVDYVGISRTKLEALQGTYQSELERMVSIIIDIKLYEQDAAQRKVKIEAILDDIIALEAQSDNQVYQILYELQNDLEKANLDVSVVNVMREAYHKIKEEKKSEYMSQL